MTRFLFSAMIKTVTCSAKEEYTDYSVREKNPSAARFFQKGFVEGSFQTAFLNRKFGEKEENPKVGNDGQAPLSAQ